jgi:hypothetical protein
MRSSDVSPRGFVLFSASVLGWIVVLSYTLKILFGASVSGDWLVIGILCNLVVVGTILMVNELFSAVEDAVHQPREPQDSRPDAEIILREKSMPPPAAAVSAEGCKSAGAQYYRIALGLGERPPGANRRRTKQKIRD